MGTYSQLLINKQPVTARSPQPSSPSAKQLENAQPADDVASNIAILQASNIAIFQFNKEDFAALQESAYKPQTFRLSEAEVEWLKDTAYQLSKELKQGRVSQVDILRISIRLFNNLMATNKANILEVLERLK
jgi:hypothetical protein